MLDADFPKQSSGRGRKSVQRFGTEWPRRGRAGLESLKVKREGGSGERERKRRESVKPGPPEGWGGCQECGVKERCPGDFFGSFQWLRLHTPTAGGWVPSLVGDLDPMCHN